MADETINQTTEEIAASNEVSRSQQRINELSTKVELTAKERDEKDALLKEAQEKNVSLEKENAFNAGFSDMLGQYSAARDHKDDIKAKVMSGYSVEDATLAVLGKAGKLGGSQAPITASDVGGGSSDTVLSTGQKGIGEMTQAERRAILEKELVITE